MKERKKERKKEREKERKKEAVHIINKIYIQEQNQ